MGTVDRRDDSPAPDDPLPVNADSLTRIAARGLCVPAYDRSTLVPRLVHVGVGGFHRAHLAAYTDELAAAGSDWGIGGLGLLPGDAAMAEVLAAQDGLYTLVVRDDAAVTARVVGSLVDYTLGADRRETVIERLADPRVAVVSLTITEGGYVPDDRPGSTFGQLAAALDRRRREGLGPVTVLSCDNVPENGDAARTAALTAAAPHGRSLVRWIEERCTFPNSMVDRITPVTDDADRRWLADEFGVVDRWPVVAEPFRQWVVEDRFAAGRPAWDDVGVTFTDDVRSWELYKLRLLNAAHSCMSYLCALAGIVHVDEAMSTSGVPEFLRGLLVEEAIPALSRIPGHPPEDYVQTVLHRFANTRIRDQIARLCIDGTAKFPSFLVPSIEHQLTTGGPVGRAALALAGWSRYLATVPIGDQAVDTRAEQSRSLASRAVADPALFLGLDAVFSPVLRSSERFRSAFVAAYEHLVEVGPLDAMRRAAPSGADGRGPMR